VYWPWFLLAGALLIVLFVLFAWRPLRLFGRGVQVERARELFVLQRERLEAQFVTAASQSGKPRGLRWVDCSFENLVAIARERKTGFLVALVGVTIQFEAVEGSDMEGLPAVGNLRNASAVFHFERGQWLTKGRAVFNLNPDEVIRHFQNDYEQILNSPVE
jgi:hypothetical protein